MEDFLIYIGKVSIAASVFYLAYLMLFQKQKHFGFNRIYLPVSLLLSFLIPVITFTTIRYVELTTPESTAPTLSFAPLTPVEYVAPAFEFQWYHYLFGLYILGVVGFFLHLLFGHLKAMHIIRTSKIQQLFDHIINITRKDVHPFSFFNKIVLSEKTLSSPDLEMIVSHEKIHVREKHTFDILFTEIMFLFQWFNPFAWLIKGAVRNNLEYITDDEIAKIYNPQKYQLAMVALADKKEVAPFLTALNGSQLKNRIIMMKKKTENKFKVARQLVVLPLLAILVMGLSNKEVKTEFILVNQMEANYSIAKKYSIADIEISGNSNLEKSELLKMSGLKIGQEIEISGSAIESAINNLLDQDLFSDVTISASKINDDNIWLNVYLEEKQTLPNHRLPTETEWENAASKENRIIRGKITENSATSPNHRLPTEAEWENAASKNKIIRGKITDKDGNPLIQVNVIQYAKPGGRAISGTVTNAKGAFVTELESNIKTLYFSKEGYKSKEINVEGKDTVNVELEKISDGDGDKSNNSNTQSLEISEMRSLSEMKNPLIIVDGVPFNNMPDENFDLGKAKIEDFGELINVAPENIESIEVLKDAASVAIWGESAKNGVLLIKTKRKDGAINSIQELRNFIDREIKFPVDARDELNDQLNMRFYVRLNNKGEITDIGENIGGDGEIFPVDEIVVTALRPKNVVKESDIKNGNLMAKEAERVLNKLPDIEIPEAKGKILEIWFKFVLQDQ